MWPVAAEDTKPMKPRLKVLFLTAFALFSLSHCSSPGTNVPLTELSTDIEPLRAEFNKDAGKVRLLLLVDPT